MLLLGIDEGTTGVKAALFDERLRPVAEARRDKVNRHPQAGWVEQDGEEVLAAVVDAVAELLDGADEEVAACGLDHQGESVLAWDAESGAPLSPIVVWQDKRSQEVLDRLGSAEEEVRELSGLPFDPYFSAAKLAWLLENDSGVAAARDAGTLRMGTVDSFLCDRLGAGFATDASTASRTQLHALGRPGFDARLGEIFGVPLDVLPEVRDTAGDLGVLRHESWPVELPLRGQVVDQQAALAGAGCVVPGRVKATYGTGVFVLSHAGDEVPRPEGGLLPTVAWRIDGRTEYALDGGVFTAGAMLEWMCRELGLAERPGGAGRAGARRRRQRRRPCTSRPGRDRRALVAPRGARRTGGAARRHHPRPRGPGGAGGNRLEGGRRGGGHERDRGRALAPGRRRPHERAAAAPAAGRCQRCCCGGRRRGRHRAGSGGAGGRGLGRDRLAGGGRRAAAGGPPGGAGARRRLADAPSTSAGGEFVRGAAEL